MHCTASLVKILCKPDLIWGRNVPKSSHKSPFFLVRELLNLYNLRTTNAIKMKLGTIVYLYDTFHLTKDLGTIFRVWQGVAKKPKKAQKFDFWA